jgi:hypothetical protein
VSGGAVEGRGHFALFGLTWPPATIHPFLHDPEVEFVPQLVHELLTEPP